VHIRRALLLFAIVLGLAAIVASFSRTDRGEHGNSPPRKAPAREASPSHGPERTVRLRFTTARGDRVQRLPVHVHAIVVVATHRPGLASLHGLGLSAPTEPGTPARFDVLETGPGRYPVAFAPAGSGEDRRIGALVVER
jgi:hypothetical protein